MSDNRRKRKKAYYVQSARKKKQSFLDVGMKGFLMTCNQNEALAVREAYSILNEYADEKYGPEKLGGENEISSDVEEDIEAALAKEVADLKETKPNDRRFKSLISGANNCLFIKTTLDSPNELCHSILSDIYETETSKSRFVLRFLPVDITCKAHEDNIQKSVEEILPKYFEKEPKSYSIMFKTRNNNQISRTMAYTIIGNVVKEINIGAHVDLHNPDFVINVDILRTVCCISVLQDYFKFRKYNIQEVAHAKKNEKLKESQEKEAVAKSEKESSENSTDGSTKKETPAKVAGDGEVDTKINTDCTESEKESSKNSTNSSDKKETPAKAAGDGEVDTKINTDCTESEKESSKNSTNSSDKKETPALVAGSGDQEIKIDTECTEKQGESCQQQSDDKT